MTSDCLFPGRVGKTWEPSAFEELLRDVTARIFEVDRDDTVVHPGHGDNTTLGTERAHWQSGANAAGDGLRTGPATRIVPAVPVIVAVTPSHPGCADAQHDRQARVRGGSSALVATNIAAA